MIGVHVAPVLVAEVFVDLPVEVFVDAAAHLFAGARSFEPVRSGFAVAV